jgi:type I phosphodiesterase/nucleotide pyrophosphatase
VITDILPSAFAVLGLPVADRLDLAARVGPVRRLAVLLVDGLGYDLLPGAAAASPFLADVVAGRIGRVDELACTLPSTTPTSLVSLGTGVLPGEHGVLGFTVNVPGTDRVLTHILWRDDPPVAGWVQAPTVFAQAAAAGIASTVVLPAMFAGSGLTAAAYGGAEFRGVGPRDDLAAAMLAALDAGPGLVYGYTGRLDGAGHEFGLAAPQWAAAAAQTGELIERLVAGLPADAALLVTADHGGLDVPESARIDLGTDPRLSAGLRVVAGEPRFRYLHTWPGATGDVLDTWRAVLGDRADVLARDEAVASGLFGPVRPQYLDRIGDVVVIPTGDTAVLASGFDPPSVADLVGFHGGRTHAETAIPLLSFARA